MYLFNKISKYEADMKESVVSLICLQFAGIYRIDIEIKDIVINELYVVK